MPLSVRDFQFLRELVRDRAAIQLGEDKMYLVETRLAEVMRRECIANAADLVLRLREQPFGDLQKFVVEAMTTQETSFFRDVHSFDMLKKTVMPQVIGARKASKRIRIWSAACATGQEPYSIAMMLRDGFPELATWSVEILATDLSEKALERAKAGRFSGIEVGRGLPAAFWVRYFDRAGADWDIKHEIRSMIDFRPGNLLYPSASARDFDVIFCRNVLIYFDVEAKRNVLENLRCALRPDGFLFLGTAETTIGVDDRLVRVTSGKASCYKLPA